MNALGLSSSTYKRTLITLAPKDCQEKAKVHIGKTFRKVPGKQPNYNKNISCWDDDEEEEEEKEVRMVLL